MKLPKGISKLFVVKTKWNETLSAISSVPNWSRDEFFIFMETVTALLSSDSFSSVSRQHWVFGVTSLIYVQTSCLGFRVIMFANWTYQRDVSALCDSHTCDAWNVQVLPTACLCLINWYLNSWATNMVFLSHLFSSGKSSFLILFWKRKWNQVIFTNYRIVLIWVKQKSPHIFSAVYNIGA